MVLLTVKLRVRGVVDDDEDDKPTESMSWQFPNTNFGRFGTVDLSRGEALTFTHSFFKFAR